MGDVSTHTLCSLVHCLRPHTIYNFILLPSTFNKFLRQKKERHCQQFTQLIEIMFYVKHRCNPCTEINGLRIVIVFDNAVGIVLYLQ